MKIPSVLTSELTQDLPVQRRYTRVAPLGEPVQAALSDYVAELRHAVRTEGPYGGVRPDVISQLRREFSMGTFGGEADVDRAVNALLKEL